MPQKKVPEKVLITAALRYANGPIHIGHLLEYIQADIYSRFLKLSGKDALYICASDMHGTPIEINAQKAGLPPEKFVEKFWHEHQRDFAAFQIQFDNYYKTHSPENQELAEYFFQTLKKKGYITRKKIEVLYCTACKRTLPDRFVKGTCPHCKTKDQYGDVCESCGSVLKGLDLLQPYCVTCKSTPQKKQSEHYFFTLSAFAPQLKKWVAAKSSAMQPEIKNWLATWFEKGLEDWCVSRDAPYFGFEIPNSKKETSETKYFYVWLDAPIGYISSTENYCEKLKTGKREAESGKKENIKKKKCLWEDYWKKGSVQHFIGKDIAYFHFLFWPAMLLAMGIPLPKITVHGFITVNGEKMSKSRGTFLTAQDFLQRYPAEALRFYYASHLDRSVVDVDLSFQELVAVNNNVLVGKLGNFCYRTLSFAYKNYGAVKAIAVEKSLQKDAEKFFAAAKKQYEQQDFKAAVRSILQIADIGNAYFQQQAPWENPAAKEKEVGWCVNLTRNLAVLVQPLLPEFSKKIYQVLSSPPSPWDALSFSWKGKLQPVEKLVEKIEEKPLAAEKEAVSKKPEEKAAGTRNEFPLQLAVGLIQTVKVHPNAEKLYILDVDLGKMLGKRQVVTGLRQHFSEEEPRSKKAIFCVNLKPAIFRGEKSEAMILAADDVKSIAILFVAQTPVGEEAAFGSLKSAQREVTFDEFLQMQMTVSQGKVVYGGEVLATSKEEVTVKLVKDGARVR